MGVVGLMIPVTDPFMSPAPPERKPGDFLRDRHGTPRVSDPDGETVKTGERKGEIKWQTYSRPSNYHKIIEDVYSITKWSERQEAYGFALTPELADKARVLIDIEDRDSEQWKDEADKIVKAAKLAAKANLSADRGTHTHALTEDDDQDRDVLTRIAEGEELGLSAEVQQSLVACWREMLERDGIEILAVEVPVVNDTYRAAGTTDRIGRLTKPLRFRLVTGEIVELPAGLVVDVDVKTGQRRIRNNGTVMYWQGYAVQVFLYASGVPYDTETDIRGEWEWEIDQRWALIAHLDVLGAIDGKPSCDLILVDLEAGRRAADLCVAAKAWGNEATVFSVAQIVVDPHYKCQHFLMGGVGHCWIDHDQIVEGEGEAAVLTDRNEEPSPSTLSPVHPPAAGEGADVSSGTTPSPAIPYATTGTHANGGNWPLADPARLALVDARSTLCATPGEGANLDDGGFDELWDRLRTEFDALDPVAKQWRSQLAQRASQRGVSFLAQEAKTERRYSINRGLIALAIVDADDEILRELLAHIIGDVALFPGVEVGHALGSLNATEAERFARHVDAYLSGPGGDAA